MNECSPLTTPVTRLAALAVGVGAAFSGGAIAGTVAGPLPPADAPSGDQDVAALAPDAAAGHGDAHDAGGAGGGGDATGHAGDAGADEGEGAGAGANHAGGGGAHSGGDADAGAAPAAPGGVLISQSGYSLQPDATALTGLAEAPFGFRIVGPDGATVQAFEPRHERELHLVVVDRDLRTYHHLHPARDGAGHWSIPMPELPAGLYRAFASFAVADGPELTLGTDLLVPGAIPPFAPLPEPTPVTLVDGGYLVELTGSPVAGVATELGLTVERGGAAVTDLEPYLGAWGHLVALRAGDLAYSHVHPVESATPPAVVPFMLEVPSPGDYRLFFDFAHEGRVHTAAFTVHVPADGTHGTAPEHAEAAATGAAAKAPKPAEPAAPKAHGTSEVAG